MLVIIDTIDGRPTTAPAELIRVARQAAGADAAITVMIAGEASSAAARDIGAAGVNAVALEHEGLAAPNPCLLAALAADHARKEGPGLVLMAHSVRACQTAALMAQALGGACVSGAEAIAPAPEGWTCRRAVFNGKLVQTVTAAAPLVVTAHPGAFGGADDQAGVSAPGTVLVLRFSHNDTGCRAGAVLRETDTGTRLEDAAVIVAAGRGIGDRENLGLIEETARLFDNAAVAASRPLCDLKWLPLSRQVGITGKTVSPRLYFACGISGSPQHLAGMKGAHCVVAVNTDPNAAIFAVADYIVVDDCRAFLRALIEAASRRR